MWLRLTEHKTGNSIIVNMEQVVSFETLPPNGGGTLLRSAVPVNGNDLHSIAVRELIDEIAKRTGSK